MIEEIFNEHIQFIKETFPDHGGKKSYIIKLEQEWKEFKDNPSIEEAVDVGLVYFSTIDAHGYSLINILEGMVAKIKKNKLRKWKLMPDGTYQHI